VSALDPITLAVIQAGLVQVCNEMDLAFCRSAFSPVISEAMDRSDGIYGRDGALIAQGDLGLPVFVGTLQFSTQAVIERVPEVRPGDVIIVNDPYLGGTHLMDVRFHKPFFYQGELFAWLSNTGHWPDTGGAVPGGFSANATEVSRRACGCRRSSSTRKAGSTRRSCRSSCPISASPISGSATSRPRQQHSRWARSA
jgi:N-methylhydantoinase B